jgi:hypothetical protein
MTVRIFRGALIQTDATGVNPSTSTVAQTIGSAMTVPENDEDFLLAFFECSIEQTASSQAQTLTFNIVDGSTVIKAFTFKTYAALKYDLVTFWAVFAKRTSSSIALKLATATNADSNTAIVLKNAFVASISGGVRR